MYGTTAIFTIIIVALCDKKKKQLEYHDFVVAKVTKLHAGHDVAINRCKSPVVPKVNFSGPLFKHKSKSESFCNPVQLRAFLSPNKVKDLYLKI